MERVEQCLKSVVYVEDGPETSEVKYAFYGSVAGHAGEVQPAVYVVVVVQRGEDQCQAGNGQECDSAEVQDKLGGPGSGVFPQILAEDWGGGDVELALQVRHAHVGSGPARGAPEWASDLVDSLMVVAFGVGVSPARQPRDRWTWRSRGDG